MNIATNIKNIIREKGLIQKYVAKQAGIPEKTFSNMLNNRKKIFAEDIPAIADALNVEPKDLFKQQQ